MATSTITFWKTGLNKANNMIIQDIWRWLDQSGWCVCTNSKYNFQYVRNNLQLTLKIDWPQRLIETELNPDYLVVEQLDKRWYYYIDSIEQVSENTLKYTCSMDVLNTFQGTYEISEHSMIERQHETRFRVWQASFDAEDHINVDYAVERSLTKEELSPALYKTSDVKIETPLSQAPYMDQHKWYLVYKTAEDGTTGSPCIELWPDEDIALEHGSGTLPEGITRHEGN